jgi:hypothetical protein
LTRGRRRAGCEGSPLDVTDAGGVERWAAALHCSGGLAGGGGPGVCPRRGPAARAVRERRDHQGDVFHQNRRCQRTMNAKGPRAATPVKGAVSCPPLRAGNR